MSSVNYGYHTGLPTFTVEMGNFDAHFKDKTGKPRSMAQGIIEKIVARELMLRNSPMIDFIKNDDGNAVMRIMFSPRTDEVDLGVFMILLQGTWFIFLHDQMSAGKAAPWVPGTPPPTSEDGPTAPHDGGVDFARLRRDRQTREDRRIR